MEQPTITVTSTAVREDLRRGHCGSLASVLPSSSTDPTTPNTVPLNRAPPPKIPPLSNPRPLHPSVLPTVLSRPSWLYLHPFFLISI